MSSSEDEVKLPVAESDVRREVSTVIARDGVDNLKSKAVREHLKNTFNVDFSAYRSQVDNVIKSCIIALNTKKPEPEPKKEVNNDAKSDSDSDSDSDPGVASPDRKPVVKKRKVSNTKAKAVKKEEVAAKEEEVPSDEDLHSAVKRRRRTATKVVERKFTKKEPGSTKRMVLTRLGRFSKVQYCTDELMALTGQRYMIRSEVVKAIWAYIKNNNCADPKNRQFAICDDILKPIFKKNRFKSFGMMKLLSENHQLIKPEDISEECVQEALEYEKVILAERNAAREALGDVNGGGEEKQDEVKEEEEDGADEDDGEDAA